MIRRSSGLALIAVAAFLAAGCGSGNPAATRDASPRPTLDVMRGLVAAIGAEILSGQERSLADTLLLDVDSSSASWVARTELARIAGGTGRRVLAAGAGSAARSRWTVRGLRLGVEYRDIRKPGLFSGAVMDRAVNASFTSEISNGDTIVYAGTLSKTAVDTVSEDSVPSLESEPLGFTRGTVPDLRTFDRFIEPFVIIGATGAAIFLFFQVRS